MLQVKRLTRAIGAEVSGVDLAKPLSDQDFKAVHAALMEHQVIFFRDQQLDHESHRRLGLAFGPLMTHPGVPGLDDFPEIVAIHADANSTYAAGEDWHSDSTCAALPPMGSILYMHTVPQGGGDTLFASMYAAYDALSPAMKAMLDPLTAVHDGNHGFGMISAEKRFPISTHPVIRTHPITGRKALFVSSGFTTRINELEKAESRYVLDFLFDHVKNPNFQVRFSWREGSVAFWDNRCTQHLAVWDYFPETRSGYRVTIAGNAPN